MRLAMVMIVLSATMISAQPQEAVDPWAARLEALSPDDAEAYYLLGEELAVEAIDADDFELVRQLYVVAFELDRTAGGSQLGASVCLALAGIERLESRRAWLRALAGAMDERYAVNEWFEASSVNVDDETALLVATALGHARAGEGLQAKRLLEKPGVREVLEEYESLLGNTGLSGGLSRLDGYITEWPCRECKNERVMTRKGTQPVQYRLCYTCEGNPGPRLEPSELISHLRFESRLLSGLQRSWAAQVASDVGEPLRDPEPADLAHVLGVNAELVYWRDGEWTDEP